MELLWETMEGLRAVKAAQGLSILGKAAYDAIERVYLRGYWDKTAVITHEEIKNPVAAAQRIIEKAGVACAHW